MHSSSFTVALAGVVTLVSAATPPNFQPASNGELIIAFGNTLAAQGIDIPKATTQTMPTIGTTMQLAGTYSIILADPDIPSGGQFLHWMQTGLVSSNVQTTVAGRQIFVLTNPGNATTAIAPFRGPAPPARAPLSHRYVLMLIDTTGNQQALTALSTAGASRNPFNAQTVVKAAGVPVMFGGWFNVTNTESALAAPIGTGRAGGGAVSPTASSGLGSPTGIPFKGDAGFLMAPGVAMAGLGSLFVLFL